MKRFRQSPLRIITNSRRTAAKPAPTAPYPSTEAERVSALLSLCPMAHKTPLVDANDLAPVTHFWIKDERRRMNLGSFKALGAAYLIARHATEVVTTPDANTLRGRTYVTASAGNHGLSVAAGARIFGAEAVVYIAKTVPESFAERLKAQNARVIRRGADYAAGLDMAIRAARENGWTLLSDSSWEGYVDLPHMVMEGYLRMASETIAQCPRPPTHILLQAGVGGMAAAVAAYARKVWGDAPRIIVVEPKNAPALQASIEAGTCILSEGPESVMGRLDCKEPSLIALNGLARDADALLTLEDDEVTERLPTIASVGLATTASGGAGIAAVLIQDVRDALGIGRDARVLCILSEATE